MAADHSIQQEAPSVKGDHEVISNTFRCRHLKAISIRNLLFPSNDDATLESSQQSAASLNSFEHRVADLSPTREQAISDEADLTSGSDDGDPVEGSDSQRSESRATSPVQSEGVGHIKLPKLPKLPKRRDCSVKGAENADKQAGETKPRQQKQQQRPKFARQVSRSLSTAFAEARQQVFEERISTRRLDSFFSLHRLTAVSTSSSGDENYVPVYVSETKEKFMNPDFKPLLPEDILDPEFLRGRTLAVRVWAKRPDEDNYTLLVEELVALPELHYVSEELDFSLAQFRDNTILFYLPDGVYTSYVSPTFDPHPGRFPSKALEAKTASFDSLMKLKKLVEVIDDATATQEAIKRQIEDLLAEHGDHEILSRSTTARFSLQNVSNAAARVDKDIARLKHDKESRKKQLAARKDAFDQAQRRLKESRDGLSSLKSEISDTSLKHASLKGSVRSHVARIAEDLLYIFPIEPLAIAPSSTSSTPTGSRPSSASSSRKRPQMPMLAFSIRGLHIPHASILAQHHPPKHDDQVSAALGFVGGIVMFLSRTLLLHIPFPIHVLGSHSVIRDDITPDLDLISNRLLLPSQMNSQLDEIALASFSSHHDRNGSADGRSQSHHLHHQHHSWAADGARTFPLYARNADPARFRWAVYLLNRDVEELISKNGLRLVDVRDTLANVRLLLVALAGGDKDANLPKREAGRVAGLQAGAGGRPPPPPSSTTTTTTTAVSED